MRTAGSFAPRSHAVLVKPENPYDVSTMSLRQQRIVERGGGGGQNGAEDVRDVVRILRR